MQSKTLILATVAALGTSLMIGAAIAQGTAGGKMFQKLDTDGSGTVSRAEVRAGQGRIFARLDADGDGTISRQEFQVIANRRFAKMDLDGDGEISLEEAVQMKERRKNNADN